MLFVYKLIISAMIHKIMCAIWTYQVQGYVLDSFIFLSDHWYVFPFFPFIVLHIFEAQVHIGSQCKLQNMYDYCKQMECLHYALYENVADFSLFVDTFDYKMEYCDTYYLYVKRYYSLILIVFSISQLSRWVWNI